MAEPKAACRRIVLKLSGEAFGPADGAGIDPGNLERIAGRIKSVAALCPEMAVVIGGGNIVRGRDFADTGISPVTADYMGMLATATNGLALQDALTRIGVPAALQTALEMRAIAEAYVRARCLAHLKKGRVVVLAAGTGNPHFSTDTAAALRARELGAELLIKATNVDGVYSADPDKDKNAKKYEQVSYEQVLEHKLRVMDLTAITLCMEGSIPIVVLNLYEDNGIERAIRGERVGTRISGESHAR